MKLKKLGTLFLVALAVLSAVSCTASRKAVQQDPVPARTLPSDADSRKHDYFLFEGQKMAETGHPEEAFQLYRHCLEIDPQSPVANYNIMPYYLYLGQDSLAQDAVEKAVRYAPDNFWYRNLLAMYLTNNKHYEAAIVQLEELTRRFPQRTEPYFTLLELYGRQSDYGQMLAVIGKLEQLMGRNEEFTMQKYRIYLAMEQPEDAIQEVEGLLQEYPDDNRYRVLLGQTYLDNNCPEEAYKLFQQVLAGEPDNVLAAYALGDYYKQTGQKEAYNRQLGSMLYNRSVSSDTKLNVMRQLIADNEYAGNDSIALIPIFDRILEEDPEDDQIPMLYAQYLWSKNMADSSGPVLERILQIDPYNKAARLMLLQVLIRKNDAEAIARICRVGTEVSPDALQFPFYLAVSCLQLNRLDEAEQACLQAVRNAPENEDASLISDIYSILGDIRHQQNRVDEAYEAYNKALEFNPLNYGVLNNYAYFLALEGRDLDRAEEMSYKTVKAFADNVTYLDTYAWILFVKGRYAEARVYIDNVLKTEEGAGSASLLEHGGDIYYKAGEHEKALELWKKAAALEHESPVLEKKIRLKKYVAE